MSRNRILIAIALIGVVVAVWLWRRGGEESSDDATTTTTVQGKDPILGRSRWFGQSGVDGRRIAGVVVGDDGAPVTGASVRLVSALTMSGLRTESAVNSDASGRFDFGAQPATSYIVAADMPRLTGAFLRVDLRNSMASPPADQLHLVLHACESSIHGTVRDSAGGVITGAMISRADSGLATSTGAETDDKGEYTLCLPTGSEAVMVRADGYAVLADYITLFGRLRRDFTLNPGTTVVGRVVRAADHVPVEGALVELRPEDPQDGGTQLSAASDADGRFHIDGVASGRHQLSAVAERLATAKSIEVVAEVGKPPQDVVCELVSSLTISGKVVERGTDTPIAGTSVYAMATGRREAFAQRTQLNAITQPDGSFVLDHLLAGEYQLLARSNRDNDDPPTTIKLDRADVTGVVISVDQAGSVAGRILIGGKPVEGARVNTEGGNGGASTLSAFDGSYVLRGIQPGTFRIYSESNRLGAFTRSQPITLAKGDHKTGVDIELDLAGSIAGVVVDQNEAPVAGVFLSFSLLHGRDFGSATTADDGSFMVRGLSGGGDYLYEVRERDGGTLTYPPAGKRHPPIAVFDGKSHVTGARVKIRLERLSIAGRITDASNKPGADIVVRASSDGYGYRAPSATTDENGAFAIRDLRTGVYRVEATGIRGEASEDNVAAGRTDVALHLTALCGIDGTLEGFASPPDVVAYRSGSAPAAPRRATVTGTTFQMRNLPAGDYVVLAMASGENESASVTVAPGVTATVALRRRETGVIEGKVVDEKTHAPISGLYCTISGRVASGHTDASGAFRLEHAPVGVNEIYCGGPVSAFGTATVSAGQVTRVELVAAAAKPTVHGRAGLTLEDQLRDVIVKSVESGGPAARAGVAVGDVLQKIDDEAVWSSYSALSEIEGHPIDTSVKLTLERGDKQVIVTLTLEAASK